MATQKKAGRLFGDVKQHLKDGLGNLKDVFWSNKTEMAIVGTTFLTGVTFGDLKKSGQLAEAERLSVDKDQIINVFSRAFSSQETVVEDSKELNYFKGVVQGIGQNLKSIESTLSPAGAAKANSIATKITQALNKSDQKIELEESVPQNAPQVNSAESGFSPVKTQNQEDSDITQLFDSGQSGSSYAQSAQSALYYVAATGAIIAAKPAFNAGCEIYRDLKEEGNVVHALKAGVNEFKGDLSKIGSAVKHGAFAIKDTVHAAAAWVAGTEEEIQEIMGDNNTDGTIEPIIG